MEAARDRGMGPVVWPWIKCKTNCKTGWDYKVLCQVCASNNIERTTVRKRRLQYLRSEMRKNKIQMVGFVGFFLTLFLSGGRFWKAGDPSSWRERITD